MAAEPLHRALRPAARICSTPESCVPGWKAEVHPIDWKISARLPGGKCARRSQAGEQDSRRCRSGGVRTALRGRSLVYSQPLQGCTGHPLAGNPSKSDGRLSWRRGQFRERQRRHWDRRQQACPRYGADSRALSCCYVSGGRNYSLARPHRQHACYEHWCYRSEAPNREDRSRDPKGARYVRKFTSALDGSSAGDMHDGHVSEAHLSHLQAAFRSIDGVLDCRHDQRSW